jgi:hypothetical protein
MRKQKPKPKQPTPFDIESEIARLLREPRKFTRIDTVERVVSSNTRNTKSWLITWTAMAANEDGKLPEGTILHTTDWRLFVETAMRLIWLRKAQGLPRKAASTEGSTSSQNRKGVK